MIKMMNEVVKLNPCPCCGGSAKLQKDKGRIDVFRVKCSQCGIKTGWWNGYAGAAEQWNKRVTEQKTENKIYLLIEHNCSHGGGMRPETFYVATSFSNSGILAEMENLARKWESRGVKVERREKEIIGIEKENIWAYIKTVPFCG